MDDQARDAVAKAPYGIVERLSPLVRRVLAHNPSPFTYTGTGTYIVGEGQVAVIDPGPDDPDHIAALQAALAGETVVALVVTHTHKDHSPAAAPMRGRTGAPVVGCAPIAARDDDGPKVEAGFDLSYAPDRILADGESVSGPGWTLTALHTPGHTSNHLCFALEEEKALFTGDHVMGWSTSVVTPPDGNMAHYMDSLRRLLDRDDALYYPTHGAAVTEPQRLVRGLIAHRRQREGQILKLLTAGAKPIPGLVAVMYANVAPVLHPAAGRSVLAHLIDMESRGLVARDGETWRLAG
ncbi:MAG: MBL fold metallo-hydrolase [Alphaproteobacteria bacterium]|nr:MBL fold metallo-hydrolase [Alphaproteobacteria bacterium]